MIVKDSSDNPATGAFSYIVTLDGSTNIESGDGFVIYDYLDYVPGSATLTPLTGGGGLSLSQFTITGISSETSPSSNPNQGNALDNPVAVNQLAQTEANITSLPNIYADPDSPDDGLSNPTFDNSATPNLNFVYSSSTNYTTSGPETYLLTLTTTALNASNLTANTVVTTEDHNPSESNTFAFAENLVHVPAVVLPEPASLGIVALGALGLLRRRPS